MATFFFIDKKFAHCFRNFLVHFKKDLCDTTSRWQVQDARSGVRLPQPALRISAGKTSNLFWKTFATVLGSSLGIGHFYSRLLLPLGPPRNNAILAASSNLTKLYFGSFILASSYFMPAEL